MLIFLKIALILLILPSIVFYAIHLILTKTTYSHFYYTKNIQYQNLNIPPKQNRNGTQNLVSHTIYGKNYFWRPNLNNQIPKGNTKFGDSDLDFDAYFEDRILLQREWITKFPKSENFSQLKPKKILVDGGFKKYYLNGKLNCPHDAVGWESKCIFIENQNKSYPTLNELLFDAVIEAPSSSTGPRKQKPQQLKLKQIFFITESPYAIDKVDLGLNNAFLASYWRGSDIPIPYGKWLPQQNTNQNHSKINYAEGKTKLAAIVVSNCFPQNARLEYINQLQRYVQVDVYGECGIFKCNNCFENLKKEYKFYLAFENANCRDYITEKFFVNALRNDMVPVVLGAHRKDYLYAAPPNSFIHVEDFDSPKELAEYLKVLNARDSMYNEFFKWKSEGIVLPTQSEDFFCRSCAALYMADLLQPPKWPQGITYEDVNACLPEQRWYWDRDSNGKDSYGELLEELPLIA